MQPRTVTTLPAGGYAAGAVRPATIVQGATTYQAPTTVGARPATVLSAPRTVQGPITTQGRTVLPGPVTQLAGTSIRQANVLSVGSPTVVSSNPATTYIRAGAPVTRVVTASNAGIGGTVSQTQQAYEAKHKDDVQLSNLKEVRKSSGLKGVPVGEALQGFKRAAVDGSLTREQFLVAYAQVLTAHQVEVPGDAVKNAVFDLFDRDDNNVVDMMELICGVSLLCSGGEDDKIHAVFDVFDENGDGMISMDEMFKFLSSVFKVVLTPNVRDVMNNMGVSVESPEDLASVTALECFKTADLNHDGKLSVEEFKNWFYAPRNDPSFMFSPVRKMLA